MMPAAAFANVREFNSPLRAWPAATKFGSLVLAIMTCFAVPPWMLLPLLMVLVFILVQGGFGIRRLARSGRPWLPVVLLVVMVHTLTTTEAAPLGRPSWLGAWRGVLALVRVAGSMMCLTIFFQTTPLQEITSGLCWWLQPLRRLGLNTSYLGLVLAVALNTVPQVLSEGRRIEAVIRLRRAGAQQRMGRRGLLTRMKTRIGDAGYLLPPLFETVFRRADGLTLSVRRRFRAPPAGEGRASTGQQLVLLVWLIAVLILFLV